MDLVTFFNILGLLIYTFFALPTLYQLQIKEYFYPKIREGIKEQQGFFIPLKMPAFSPRNVLIIGFVFLVMALYFYILEFSFEQITLWYSFFWLLGLFLSKLSVVVGMLLTEPLAALKRNKHMRDARVVRNNSDVQYVGITGSYGKTSTKEFLASILSERFNVAKTEKNNNTEVSVALGILNDVTEDHDFFIAEMGAYTLGEVERAASIAQPTYGFITGIGNQHITLFGSQENIIDAKCELLEALPADGTLYLNADFFYSDEVRSRAECKVVTYSLKNLDADVVVTKKDNSRIIFKYGDLETEFESILDVDHHLLNMAGCLAFALDMGLTEDELQRAILKLTPPDQKLSKRKLKNGATVIDDSYNSNEEGFLAGIEYLGGFEGNKTILTQGILELGDDKASAYDAIVTKCSKRDIRIITNDRDFEESDFIEQIPGKSSQFLQYLAEADENEVFLIEGNFPPNFRKGLKDLYEI